MNQFELAKHFWSQHRKTILAAPKNEWAVDPYAWSEWIRLTPIEEALWTDIRQANSVFYPQWPEAGYFLDFANPKAKVALECDGAAYHQDKEKDARAAQAAWAQACSYLADPAIGLVVLDELTYAFKYGWLELDAVLSALAARPPAQHVVITGRAAPDALRAAADTVSDIGNEKHAFKAGVKAMPGLDY